MTRTSQPMGIDDGAAAVTGIAAWEDDPGTTILEDPPPANQPMQQVVPDFDPPGMPVGIAGTQPVPGTYQVGTTEFRYWAAAEALARGARYWSGRVPSGTTWQPDNGPRLIAVLDQGEDLNAYYDRNGLHFFHGSVRETTVFSGESPDVVCHELGHAVLDAVKPQLWGATSIEAAAFHESFGDCSSILCNLQTPSLREAVLNETNGRVGAASRLSRVAESLGWAIRQLAPDAVSADCLRSAVNSFYYQNPASLPPSAPSAQLSSEPHSFSRVFTAGFFRTLSGIFSLQPQQTADTLLTAANDAGTLLIEGIRRSPVVPALYAQVAAHMVAADTALFRGRYRRAIISAFVRCGVLSVRSAAALGNPAEVAAVTTAAEPGSPGELTSVPLAGAAYGLPGTLMVRAATDPLRFSVAGGVPDRGDTQPPAPDQAAGSFVEDLIRRGRIAAPEEIIGAAPIVSQGLTTHEIAATDLGLELRRTKFDCGFRAG